MEDPRRRAALVLLFMTMLVAASMIQTVGDIDPGSPGGGDGHGEDGGQSSGGGGGDHTVSEGIRLCILGETGLSDVRGPVFDMGRIGCVTHTQSSGGGTVTTIQWDPCTVVLSREGLRLGSTLPGTAPVTVTVTEENPSGVRFFDGYTLELDGAVVGSTAAMDEDDPAGEGRCTMSFTFDLGPGIHPIVLRGVTAGGTATVPDSGPEGSVLSVSFSLDPAGRE